MIVFDGSKLLNFYRKLLHLLAHICNIPGEILVICVYIQCVNSTGLCVAVYMYVYIINIKPDTAIKYY